jgi:hypothetical protein
MKVLFVRTFGIAMVKTVVIADARGMVETEEVRNILLLMT